MAAVAVCVGLTACQQGSDSGSVSGSSPAPAEVSAAPAPDAVVTATPAAGATQVRPDTPVVISADGGQLESVSVADADGVVVEGQMSQDGATWTSTDGLAAGASYSVTASAVNPDQVSTPFTSTFATAQARDIETAEFQPKDGWNVGVGMPVIVYFDADVQDRAAVEKRLEVTSTPAVEGAWRWISDNEVQFRPREFWPSGTTVTVDADLRGIEFPNDIWGVAGKPATFTVGSAMVSTVDIANHTLTVTKDGETIRTIPVTTGKKGYETREGTKLIMTRESSHRMDAATTGVSQDSPEYYNLTVRYAMRLTWSGEFFHAAPWSVASQGRENVSHGCTGLSMADAKWFMDNSKVGDVAQFVNGSRPLEDGNGWTVWDMSFEEWKAGSALT